MRYKQAWTKEYVSCKENPAYFIFNYCHSLDSKSGLKKLLPKYDYCIEFINEIEKARKLGIATETLQKILVEKTRQMTISWLSCAYVVWGLLFVDNFSCNLLSRKEEYVDKKADLKALFPKCRYIIKHLPPELSPEKDDIEMTYMQISYKKRGSILTGESSNSDAGRGGDVQMTIADEFAKIPNSEHVLASIAPATKHVLLLISTPWGKSNAFYRLRFAQNTGYIILTYHWRRHPGRDDKWYEEQCKTLGWNKLLIGSELDVSYEDSIAGKIWDFNSVDIVLPYNLEAIKNEIKGLYVITGSDYGYTDHTAFIYAYAKEDKAKKKLIYYIFDCHIVNKQPVEFHANLFKETLNKYGINQYRTINYGDPEGKAKEEGTGKSLFEEYSVRGVNILCGLNDITLGITKIGEVLGEKRIYIYDNCYQLVDALVNARVPVDKDNKPKGEKYVHDDNSHVLDALRYMLLTHEGKPELLDDREEYITY
jgi:hypothetical protein